MNVIIPEKDIYKPLSNALRANSLVDEKQWIGMKVNEFDKNKTTSTSKDNKEEDQKIVNN